MANFAQINKLGSQLGDETNKTRGTMQLFVLRYSTETRCMVQGNITGRSPEAPAGGFEISEFKSPPLAGREIRRFDQVRELQSRKDTPADLYLVR